MEKNREMKKWPPPAGSPRRAPSCSRPLPLVKETPVIADVFLFEWAACWYQLLWLCLTPRILAQTNLVGVWSWQICVAFLSVGGYSFNWRPHRKLIATIWFVQKNDNLCLLVKSGAGCFFDCLFYQISRNIDLLKPSSHKRERGFR